jgi:hypothetical protein
VEPHYRVVKAGLSIPLVRAHDLKFQCDSNNDYRYISAIAEPDGFRDGVISDAEEPISKCQYLIFMFAIEIDKPFAFFILT